MKYLTTIMFIFILNSLYAQQKEVLSEPLQVKKIAYTRIMVF